MQGRLILKVLITINCKVNDEKNNFNITHTVLSELFS